MDIATSALAGGGGLLSLLPVLLANLFLAFVVVGTVVLCVKRVLADDLADGVPGDVPQVVISAAVVIVLLLGVLGVTAAVTILRESAGAVAAIIPLSLSPWLLYKGYKAKVGDTEVDTVSGSEPKL